MASGNNMSDGLDSKKAPESPLKLDIPLQTEQRSSDPGPSSNEKSGSPQSPKSVALNDQKPKLWPTDVHKEYEPGVVGPMSSWSTSSDKQLGSPGSDRVFPIRSVVSVDPSQTPSILQSQKFSGDQTDYFPTGMVPTGAGGKDNTSSFASRHRSSGQGLQDDGRPTPRGQKLQTPRTSGEGRRERKSSISGSNTNSDRYGGGSRMQLFNDAGSDRSKDVEDSASLVSTTKSTSTAPRSVDGDSMSGLVTARFKHVITAEGHAVITGRDGETLQRCEDEPIHIPGAVQSFGLLVALSEQSSGDFLVRIVSENSKRIIGYTPQELFKLRNFTDILSEEQAENLLDHVDFIRDEDADPATNGPEVFTISVKAPGAKKNHKLWCAMHINTTQPDMIICEFELDDDQLNPLVPTSESDTPDPPEDTINSQPTQEEYEESTHATSKPLRVLRSARKRKGEAAAMEVFNIMSQVQEQLASAPNLEKFLKILVGVVKELTGFHRVMVYQFDATFNGRVVTELVDPRATKDLYKGLNFPASDIPKQARDLYKINKVRLLYDRDLETSRLVCRSIEDLENPLDMSFSYLRAMSPIHIKYLANMAVRSSMSISINAFGELWGLIACHSYGPKGMRVSFPIRKMCRLVGDTASRNIERLSYASRLQARKLINTIPTEANPSGYIIASSDDLLSLFDADCGLLSIRGETKILGKIEHSQEALAMLEYLRMRQITSVVTSQDIRTDFPDLRYSPGFEYIAGLLLVPLTASGGDFIVFFRRGQVKEVKWAGNPYEKFIKQGTEGYLEPRKSFKMWSETVVGKCREWTEEQVETAAVLCLVYGKFIEVWRQKEAALQNSQLTRLLLANSAHEVRTPLHQIINFLEIALEGTLDKETRENLSKSHSASKSLIFVINDILDLTKTEEGHALIKDEVFDLLATIKEATEVFSGDAKRKGIEYDVIEYPGIPKFVHGDQRRVRQAIQNITANAIQHTSKGGVRVEIWQQEVTRDRVTIEIAVQDSGAGMSNEKLDKLFRDLEQVTTDDEGIFGDKEIPFGDGADEQEHRTLGLGLALVARIVRNMDGQLRLKSEEGKGSRFVIQLPFALPEDHTTPDDGSMMVTGATTPSAVTTPPVVTEGEVTLVDRPSSLRAPGVARKSSLEELASLHSFRSGSSNKSNGSKKSDVDRLIDAISGPLQVGEPESTERTLQRANSKGSAQASLRSVASHNTTGSSGSLKGTAGHGASNSTLSSIGHEHPPARPGAMVRSRSFNTPEHLRSPHEGPAGSEFVNDNKTLLRAVRMPDEFSESSETSPPAPPSTSRVLFDIPDRPKNGRSTSSSDQSIQTQNSDHLQILIAEDDPVNSRILQKRLSKSGHEVHNTVNGEECASAYGESARFYDVVLMDMQMPIVDGLTSTKLIRSYEKSHPQSNLSPRAALNSRVPIFAVSASLIERERQTYINAGFDGWILKPIDFKRLNVLLDGIVDEAVRNKCLYKPGEWERGGWFNTRQQQGAMQVDTRPNLKGPGGGGGGGGGGVGGRCEDGSQPGSSLGSSESGSITPKMEPRKPLIHDERLDKLNALAEEKHEEEGVEYKGVAEEGS